MWADPEVTRYIGGTPLTEEESWARLLRYVGHWSLLGFGYWVVEEKTTGNFIGEVGFADYKRDLPSLKDLPEIGWVFSSQASGKGYATEAVRAASAWVTRASPPRKPPASSTLTISRPFASRKNAAIANPSSQRIRDTPRSC